MKRSLDLEDKNRTNKKTKDGIGKKGAFVRNFAHVDGNWPSHVYITVPKTACLTLLQAIYCDHFNALSADNFSELESVEDLHISLSQPFALKAHQIDGYIGVLGKAIENFVFSEAVYRLTLSLELGRYSFLRNENKTRLFQCIPLSPSPTVAALIRLIKNHIDLAMKSYHLPVYYDNPILHFSIASARLACLPSPSTSNNKVSSNSQCNQYGASANTNANTGTSAESNADVPCCQTELVPYAFMKQWYDTHEHEIQENMVNDVEDQEEELEDLIELISDEAEKQSRPGINYPYVVKDRKLQCLCVDNFSIECKIGNRLFRCKLDKSNSSTRFEEVLGSF